MQACWYGGHHTSKNSENNQKCGTLCAPVRTRGGVRRANTGSRGRRFPVAPQPNMAYLGVSRAHRCRKKHDTVCRELAAMFDLRRQNSSIAPYEHNNAPAIRRRHGLQHVVKLEKCGHSKIAVELASVGVPKTV